MKEKFLTKNTKISIQEEASPPGLRVAKKVHDEDGKINRKALTKFAAKLKDYYGDELKELDPIPKVTAKDEVGSDKVNVFDIEALGSGKMSALEYEAEGSEVEKKFKKRVDDLNDTSDYDKNFGTKDGFGETDEPDDTYEKLKKAAAEYNKFEDLYELPNPLRVTQAKTIQGESKNIKTKKMKRLNFKNKFNTEYEMLQLIPENYKVEGNVFLMTDGNQTYKVRWDKTLKEGTILNYRDNKMISENTNKMKKLYNYKYSDQNKKTNSYLTEAEIMRKMMDAVKGKTLINEQEEVEVDPFDDGVIQQKAADKAAADKAAAAKAAIPKPVTSNLEKTYKIGGQDIVFRYPQLSKDGGKTQEDRMDYPITIRGPKGYVLIDKKTHKVTKGDPKKSFYIQINSSPNGSMMTAYDDFIKYVSTTLPNLQYKPYTGNKSEASQGTIDRALTLLPQYYTTNKGQTKDFNITDDKRKDAEGQPYNWLVRVTYSDNVDGNGKLKKKIVNNIMWLDADKGDRYSAARPEGSYGNNYWFDGTALISGQNKNIALPGEIVTKLGEKIKDEIWKPERIHGSKVSQDPGPGVR